MAKFTVLDLLDLDLQDYNALQIKCLAGRKGLVHNIDNIEMNRPGLALTGFFETFTPNRIQIFGGAEYEYLKELEKFEDYSSVDRIFTYDIPFCVFCNNLKPADWFLEKAEAARIPVLQTSLQSHEFSIRIMRTLGDIFAPKKTVHGVLVEVYGVGVLIKGESGVGKSETALELIERGHRLVADDSVLMKCFSGKMIMGFSDSRILGHHMEIRGLGIINISQIFGVRGIRDKKQVELVINLEEWDVNKNYDRLGTAEDTTDILGVKIPTFNIPVKPGRNIPIIIETAALNERLKKKGHYSAKEFNKNLIQWLESENARNMYQDNYMNKQE
ncbi:MAG: HPr kinase/phosphorylase [Spirochaetaceae bacterium 4572_59]|nr:MAG: HPr kinase/phosphorylase [Spirochaetaceae bacterium 4572_59]